MTHKIISAGTAILVFCLLGVADPKPNFSGAWVMDRGRSFGLPGNMQQTMTVIGDQSADQEMDIDW